MVSWLLDKRLDALDPTLEPKKILANLVKAHAHGIRIVLDGVINHTGPVTDLIPFGPTTACTNPACDYKTSDNTTLCMLFS
jgi:alpha-amylase